ncbi:MAG: Lon protease family protein [Bacteroidota bacterium]
MPNKHKLELPAEKLRWHCNPKSLGIRSTENVKSSRVIIGQDRAIRSLRLGLEMKHAGYNVFVTGYTGTGRKTMIKMLLSEFENKTVPLRDRIYLYNFRNEDQPMFVTLPAGQGIQLSEDMQDLLQELLKDIPAAFESKRFQDEKKRLFEHFQSRQRSVLKDFEKKVKSKGFEVVQVQGGMGARPDIAPVVENAPVSFEQLDALVQQGTVTKEKFEQMMEDRAGLESNMDLVLRELRNIDRKAKESMEELTHGLLVPLVQAAIDEVSRRYNNEKLKIYFSDLSEEILGGLDRFRPQEDQSKEKVASAARDENPFIEFQVNVVVDNSETKGIPIIHETNPKYKNIFGTIEREIDRNGMWKSDFTQIKSGSLLLADGGFLVLNALDALTEPYVWQTLKRTLRNQLLEIQSPDSSIFGATSALKPEPIDIDVKIIMIGDAEIYHILYEQDDDFKKIFKVRADFDIEMPRDKATVTQYIGFIKLICENDNLLPFDATGIAAVLEQGARLAGHQKKLSTRFNAVADVARESSYWAMKDKAKMISAKHVLKGIAERIDQVKMVEDKLQEMIIDGSILIDTEGAEVGQVNGLSVYDMGNYMFGKPSRITAKTSLGRQGIINIEREAALSGPTHNKGVLILSGYLRSVYAQNKPLVLSASIAFEQSYGGVDGDSASSTEIYAILSSIAGIPLRQDLAVTGSINQKGEIQPIGGVNQKVEGFFDVCKTRGLTGKQGVIIPHQNSIELMLRYDIIDAVRKGKFHIYGIKHIEEGLELLTGMRAGNKLRDGSFAKGTIHYLVDLKLTQYSQRWNELSKD